MYQQKMLLYVLYISDKKPINWIILQSHTSCHIAKMCVQMYYTSATLFSRTGNSSPKNESHYLVIKKQTIKWLHTAPKNRNSSISKSHIIKKEAIIKPKLYFRHQRKFAQALCGPPRTSIFFFFVRVYKSAMLQQVTECVESKYKHNCFTSVSEYTVFGPIQRFHSIQRLKNDDLILRWGL